MKNKILSLVFLLFFLGVIPLLIYFGRKAVIFQPKAAGSGTMILSGPTSVSLTVPCSASDTSQCLSVDVIANTGPGAVPAPQSRGFDVSINFPTNRLQLVAIIPATNATLKTFMPVNSSLNFDSATVIANANAGSGLMFSALPIVKSNPSPYPLPTYPAGTPTPIWVPVNPTPANNFVSGSVQLATLKFKPLTSGTAAIAFNFALEPAAGWRNDTNISSVTVDGSGLATDLLSSVTNLNVTISGGATSTPTVTPGAGSCNTNATTCPKGANGDLTCNSVIDGTDLSLMLLEWGPNSTCSSSTQWSPNIAGSAGVDATDLSKLLLNFGK